MKIKLLAILKWFLVVLLGFGIAAVLASPFYPSIQRGSVIRLVYWLGVATGWYVCIKGWQEGRIRKNGVEFSRKANPYLYYVMMSLITAMCLFLTCISSWIGK